VTGSPIIASRPTATGIRLLERNQNTFSAISHTTAQPTSTGPQGAGITNRASTIEPTTTSTDRSVATRAREPRDPWSTQPRPRTESTDPAADRPAAVMHGGAGSLSSVAAEPGDARRYGRRGFLLLVAGGVSSLAWATRASNVFSPLTSAFSQAIGNLIPVDGWRIYTISGSMPTFDPRSWRLEIGGLVRTPVSLDYEALLKLPRAEQVSTFHCVTGWTVRNVHWAGVRFEHLLELAEPRPSAKAIRFDSLEIPYNDSLTIEQALLPDVMLAYELGGKPLSRPHGAPARVVIPEMYGYKGVKWLARMELVAEQPTGYWEALGYDQNAWVGRSNGYQS
jgi:DMSO/TMAO reductase YedYZ molybdopterin-dependent catalytic subunit